MPLPESLLCHVINTDINLSKLLLEAGRDYFTRVETNFDIPSRYANNERWFMVNRDLFEKHEKELSYISFNPLKLDPNDRAEGAESFKKLNVNIDRWAFTVEYDKISLEKQWELMKDVPSTIMCYSGNKSIHTHMIFDRVLTNVENTLIGNLLRDKFSSDPSTLGIGQVVRSPGGYNDKEKEHQSILKIGKRLNVDEIIVFLSKLPNSQKEPEHRQTKPRKKAIKKNVVESVTTISEEQQENNSTPLDSSATTPTLDMETIRFKYFESILDLELKTIRRFSKMSKKKYETEPGVTYFGHCPNNNSHTDGATHSNEFNVFLTYSGNIKKKCFHASCSELWNVHINQLLDLQHSLFSDYYRNIFIQSDYAIKNNIRWNDLPGTTNYPEIDIAEVAKELKNPLCPDCNKTYLLDNQTQLAICECSQLDVVQYYHKNFPGDISTSQAIDGLKDLADKHRDINHLLNRVKDVLIPAYTTVNKDLMYKRIQSVVSNDVLFIKAPTGTGKTYMMCQCALEMSKASKRLLLVGSTTTEARRILTILKQFDPTCDVSLMISGEDYDDEDPDDADMNQTKNQLDMITYLNRDITVTTYGYCGRYGETAHGYMQWHKMIEGRVIIMDECQTLYINNLRSYTLTYRMFQKKSGDDYIETITCPIRAGKGLQDCSKCKSVSAKQGLNVYRNRPPFRVVREDTIDKHQMLPNLGIIMNQNPFQFTSTPSVPTYSQVNKTLFWMPLPDWKINVQTVTDLSDKSEVGFYNSLSESLYNPQFRVELPIDKVTGDYINYQTALNNGTQSNVILPKQACEVPRVCGYDTLPLQQLMGQSVKGKYKVTDFKGADSVIMMSATIPPQLVDICRNIMVPRFNVQEFTIDEIPATFDISILKTSEQLGIRRLADLGIKLFHDPLFADRKFMLVTATKAMAKDLYKKVKNSCDGVKMFHGQDYDKIREPVATAEEGRIIVTYGRSAIMQGMDFKDYDVMVIDAGLYKPFAAIFELTYSMSDIQRNEALVKDIAHILTQAMGRLLRTNIPLVPGNTIQDPRKIVFVIHNLPEELLGFKIDTSLAFAQVDYINTWMRTDKKVSDSIVDSVKKCVQGLIPVDFSKIQRSESVSKDYWQVSQKTRETYGDEFDKKKQEKNQAREVARFNARVAGGKMMIDGDRKWREICSELNLSKYPEVKSILNDYRT